VLHPERIPLGAARKISVQVEARMLLRFQLDVSGHRALDVCLTIRVQRKSQPEHDIARQQTANAGDGYMLITKLRFLVAGQGPPPRLSGAREIMAWHGDRCESWQCMHQRRAPR